MPTYSYACTECDNNFDAVQAFTDDALTSCPQCSGRLRKLFGSVGVVFKGSGFYRNDSRDTSKSTINGSNGESSSAPSEKSDKSAEKSKPAEKSDKSSSSSGSSDKSSSSTGSASKSSSPAAASS
ncbi:MAG: FmdB family zinc ribbon protein [Mycobacterium sp.]